MEIHQVSSKRGHSSFHRAGTIANAHSDFNFAKVSGAFSRSRRRVPPGEANPHPSGDSEKARAAQSAPEGTYLVGQNHESDAL